MWSIIPASVVVLPDPVGPVTRTRPRGSIASAASASGSPRSGSGMAPTLTRRKTRPAEPRERKALTRKRPTPGSEYAKSASLVLANSSRRSSRSTSEAMNSVSAAVRTSACSLRSRPSIRTRGGEPTLQCRSDPPNSASARRKGSIDRGGFSPVTEQMSARGSPIFTPRREPTSAGSQPGGGSACRSADLGDDVALLDDVSRGHVHGSDGPGELAEDGDLHLHRLEDHDGRAGLDHVADVDGHA